MTDKIEDQDTAGLPDLASEVQHALDRYYAAGGGGLCSRWVLVSEGIDSDGSRIWVTREPDDQTPTVTLGLLGLKEEIEREAIRSAINANDEL